MARFARTSRRSSTYRGTFTTKPSPLASEKVRRATAGSSLEILYLLIWPQKGEVAYAPTSDFPLLGIAADVIAICRRKCSISMVGLLG
jgi:hypothetical protein